MSLEQTIKALMLLGLTETDSIVYVYLAKKGPLDEKDLANKIKMGSHQLCLSLRKLEEKGFVISENQTQTILIAVPLEKVIDKILKTQIEDRQRLEQAREYFLSNPTQ